MSSNASLCILFRNQYRAEQWAAYFQSAGYVVHVANNSDEFYSLLNAQRVDCVLIENQLNGFLLGLEILERLYRDLVRPVTVMLADLDEPNKTRAQKIGVDRVLTANTEAAMAVDIIHSLLVCGEQTRIFIPASARRIVNDVEHIAPLPQIVVRLSSYLDATDCSPAELAREISVDPRITAELIRLANSSAFGRSHRTVNLSEVIQFLGIRRTIAIVISNSLLTAQSHLVRSSKAVLGTWFTRRSVLIGSTAAAFAQRMHRIPPDTAYVLGLLQDIGILVLAHAFGESYTNLLDRVNSITQVKLEMLEKEDFDTTHADVSAAIMQRWQLPHGLVKMVQCHHERDAPVGATSVERGYHQVMQVGESFANLSDRWSPHRHQRLNQLLAGYGAETSTECRTCFGEAIARTAESSRLFSVPLPNEDALLEIVRRASLETANGLDETESQSLALTSADSTHDRSSVRSRIHVIDDEAAIANLIRCILEPYEVDVTYCGSLDDESIDQLQDASAILCDVHLNGMQGDEMVGRLRKSGYERPIIMISGDSRRATVASCIEHGVNDYLLKPFNAVRLIEKLQQFLPLSLNGTAATSNPA